MVGKHIFVRCRNEQNNAGTWTAAMTDGIVDKDTVRNSIEPRCNMEETFAQENLMACPTNNVLRMYYVNEDTLVVTRTYWVTDRLTEIQGRRGAYSVSYILTDDDIARFCNDFSGAFDTNCFEPYDELVARAEAAGGKITIDPERDIYSHSGLRSDMSVLRTCGFTKDTFVRFMNGLYDAVENNGHIALILPKNIREAWEKNNDDTAERLAHYILGILPDFMRVNVGLATHWSCRVNDRMLSDVHLIFVHPLEGEEISKELRDSGAHVVDLDGGKYGSKIPDIASDYFSFVWDNLDNMSECEEFWSYCKTNFRKLLRGRPTSAAAMECIYLMRKNMQESYSDSEKCRKALLLAAEQFAGAGTKIPLAEEFISEALGVLKIENEKVEKDVEVALCTLVSDDNEKTKHQLQTYKILLNCIEQGSASPDTVQALCGEVAKENRGAVGYFFSYLTDKQESLHESITPQMTLFISGLYIMVLRHNVPASYELSTLVMKLMKSITERLYENAAVKGELIMPFAQAYIACIKSDDVKFDWIKAAYEYLFFISVRSDGELYDLISGALQKEEVRIYRNLADRPGNGGLRMAEFADAFLAVFPALLDTKRDVLQNGYDRLFRMIFNPISGISEKASGVYRSCTAELIVRNGDFVEKVQELVLSCEENALRDKLPNWSDSHGEKTVILVEYANFEMFPKYYPVSERFALIAEQLSAENDAVYPLLAEYLAKMPFDVRQETYNLIREKGMADRLFVHMLLHTANENLKSEIAGIASLSYEDAKKCIYAHHNTSNDDEVAVNRFLEWYKNELSKVVAGFDPMEDFPKQYSFIKEELSFYAALDTESVAIVRAGYHAFYNTVFDVFNGLPKKLVGTLTDQVINEIIEICDRSPVDRELTLAQTVEFIKNVDELIKQGKSAEICRICENSVENEEENYIVKSRMLQCMKAGRCPAKNACRMYGIMLEAGTLADYPLEKFLEASNYNSLTDLQKGNFLVDMMLQLHNDKSRIEQIVGLKIMQLLEGIANDNPKALINNEFIGRWKNVRGFEYTTGTRFVYIMNKAVKSKGVKFDIKMFLLCILGHILTCVIMGLIGFAVVKLASLSVIVLAIVAVLILMILFIGDILLFVSLISSGRRKNR